MQESSITELANPAPFTPLDDRDELALDVIAQLKQAREGQQDDPEPEPEDRETAQPANDFEQFDEESAKQLLSYGLGSIQLSVGAIFNVPFEIDEEAGNKWLDRATPMLMKYGPAGLEWFGRYKGEIFFAMATFSLVGGSAVQIRRLQAEKVVNQAEAEVQPEEEPKDETAASH